MERLLSAKDLCSVFGVSRATLYRMRSRGELPAPIIVSMRAKRWKASEIDSLIGQRGAEHGSRR